MNATNDALMTATRQLETERSAVAKLTEMGCVDSLDMRFAQREVVRLESLVARLTEKVGRV